MCIIQTKHYTKRRGFGFVVRLHGLELEFNEDHLVYIPLVVT